MAGVGVNEWNMHSVDYYYLVMPLPFFAIVSIYGCNLSVAQTLHCLYKSEPRQLCRLALKTKDNWLNILEADLRKLARLPNFCVCEGTF